jgi:hypothetical protein
MDKSVKNKLNNFQNALDLYGDIEEAEQRLSAIKAISSALRTLSNGDDISFHLSDSEYEALVNQIDIELSNEKNRLLKMMK